MKVRIGLFGVGLYTYWPQFAGLLGRLTSYQAAIGLGHIADKIEKLGRLLGIRVTRVC